MSTNITNQPRITEKVFTGCLIYFIHKELLGKISIPTSITQLKLRKHWWALHTGNRPQSHFLSAVLSFQHKNFPIFGSILWWFSVVGIKIFNFWYFLYHPFLPLSSSAHPHKKYIVLSHVITLHSSTMWLKKIYVRKWWVWGSEWKIVTDGFQRVKNSIMPSYVLLKASPYDGKSSIFWNYELGESVMIEMVCLYCWKNNHRGWIQTRNKTRRKCTLLWPQGHNFEASRTLSCDLIKWQTQNMGMSPSLLSQNIFSFI